VELQEKSGGKRTEAEEEMSGGPIAMESTSRGLFWRKSEDLKEETVRSVPWN
jgi:hypothetical protein